jgi:hypothetical protein
MIEGFRLATYGGQRCHREKQSCYAKLNYDITRGLHASAHGEKAGCEYIAQSDSDPQQPND